MGRIIVLSLLLAGCAVQSHDAPVFGKKVTTPVGWFGYCARHPTDVDCKK
jgi:hypothetical protein